MFDALFSLPIISFFALPMLSSYSTSLNLLFFYMTWMTLVLSHTSLNVEIFGTLIVRLLFFLLPGLVFLAFDCAVPSVAEYVKAQGDVALPRRYGSRKLGFIVFWSIFNVLLEIVLAAGVSLLFTRVLHIRSVFLVAVRLPSPWSIVTDLARGFAIRGVLQFYIHRHVLHNSQFPLLSKAHKQWAHSIASPFSLTAAYDHPACYLVHHTLPTYLPALLFRTHVLTFDLFLALASLEELLTWSGYAVLPSRILLTGMARRHDMHHLSGGTGNFAPWGLLDWVHGTSVSERDITDDLQDEWDKRDGSGKVNAVVDGVGDKVRNRGKKGKK